MLINSSAPTGAYASSRPISAVSSATSSGELSGMKLCGRHSAPVLGPARNMSAASAAARSIPCTRQRPSASAKASTPTLQVRGQGERRHHGGRSSANSNGVPLSSPSTAILAHASGDAINAVLATAGYNFRRLLAWLMPRLFMWRRQLGWSCRSRSRTSIRQQSF
jgi:hypothetical protein